MNRTSLDFLDAMFPFEDRDELNILIINQTKIGSELKTQTKNIRVINSYEKGISKSRNLAIKNTIGDICLIADDDTEFASGFQEEVKNTFFSFDKASLIQFRVRTFEGNDYKTYPKKSKKLNCYSDIIHVSSVEIAFRRQDILNMKIKFNELFGLGSVFKSGEEFLFLRDLLKNDLIMWHVNKYIVKHSSESSTDIGCDNYIKTKAVLYYISYRFWSDLYIFKFLAFLYRKNIMQFKDFGSKYKMSKMAIKTYKKLSRV
ncbi:MAG: glycosyltransferase family 2 protein [Winogradskyella sp.]|uniref:glycosyltransferase family 2 protein n=1 Tax=Winogradskyella sp. TaxID=1883156 RepID=UPI0017C57455|nr:glycosyltransferase family A protein [Winogradskyella sp.]MBT8245460.1 glycosyltransferase family 2 protein [Winogradskyella sp.]NNK22307.1 glycosyltransferase family 2 protein [Winogradskyella sp.]